MEILAAIDKALSNVVVRWLLLAAATAALATATWAKMQLGTVRLQRDAAQGQNATYRAHLEVQNAAILKQGDEMEDLIKRLKLSQADVEKSREALKKRQSEVIEVVLHGNCPEMVQQVLDEVRK